MAKINLPAELIQLSDFMKEQEQLNEQYDLALNEIKENRKRLDSFKREKEIQALIKKKKNNHE